MQFDELTGDCQAERQAAAAAAALDRQRVIGRPRRSTESWCGFAVEGALFWNRSGFGRIAAGRDAT
jgi:hypothetical protein